MKKNKKILFLGALTLSISSLPLVFISCETSKKGKLKRALRKNKSYRASVTKKLGIPNDYEDFAKRIYDELSTKLNGVTNKAEREKIYDEIINKVYTSTANLTDMYDTSTK